MREGAIYLDSNATTPVLPAVREGMLPFLAETFGNPSSAHQFGRRARKALEDTREKLAALLGARAEEVLFTSGATESNNLAVFGLAGDPPGSIVCSPIEHPCVVEPVRQLAGRGHQVAWLAVNASGVAKPELPLPDVRLACLMMANHETGAVQPVAEMAALAPLHCDAAQAAGKMPISFQDLGAATLSLSAHKFHGPRGVGALLVRRGVRLRPLFFGGHQQRGLRPGTEPVALAVGMATALELAERERERRWQQVVALRSRFRELLCELAAPLVLNGPEEGGLPHTLNLSFPGLKSDALLMALDLAGVACSTGSACSSGSLLPSPVLEAMGVPDDVLRSAMRFSFTHLLSIEEIEEAARRVVRVVGRLRALQHGEAGDNAWPNRAS